MDTAIIRGTVDSEITVIKGDGQERAQFLLNLHLEEEEKVEGKSPVTYSVMTSVLATGNPELTRRIQAIIEKGDDVILYGQFGMHNGRMKMRVSDLSIPHLYVSGC